MHRKEPHEYIQRVFGEVGKPTKGGPVVRDDEVAFMLAVTADLMSRSFCLKVDCEKCDSFNALWWEWCNSLSGPIRIRLQGHLRNAGIPFPPGPYEETPRRDLSTARN